MSGVSYIRQVCGQMDFQIHVLERRLAKVEKMQRSLAYQRGIIWRIRGGTKGGRE